MKDLLFGEAFRSPSGCIVAGTRVFYPKAAYGRHVQCAIRRPVSAAIEALAASLSRGGRQGRDTAEHGEGGLTPHALRVLASGDEQLGGNLHPHAGSLREARVYPCDQGGDQVIKVGDLLFELQDAPG